jgi:hypothetical protein
MGFPADDTEEHSASHNPTIQFLNTGLRLQEKQRELKRAIAKKDLAKETVMSCREALSQEIRRWRKDQTRMMGSKIEDKLMLIDNEVEAEDQTLYLPSDIPHSQHSHYQLQGLAKIEYQLHEGEANDAVTAICEAVIHSMLLLDHKAKHVHGQQLNLRSSKYINGMKYKRDAWAAQYHAARQCLLQLVGVDAMEDFPVLRDEDMYAKNAAGARGLGEGKVTDSWIWTYGKLKYLDDEERKEFLLASELCAVKTCNLY